MGASACLDMRGTEWDPRQWSCKKDSGGQPTIERFFRHSRKAGTIRWEDADETTVARVSTKAKNQEDVFNLVPFDSPIPKNTLIRKCQEIGIGEKKAKSFIDALLENGKLFIHLTKRPRTNDLVSLAKYAQQGVIQ